MSDDALAQLTDEVGELTAPGTDPGLVAALLGWSVRPRRTLEGLRRVLAEQGGADRAPSVLLHAATRGRVDAGDAAAASRLLPSWRARRCRLSVVGDSGYPARLAEGWPGTDGPVLLVTSGAVPPAGPTVAIVGARNATSYGTGIAAWLAEAAAAAGVHVVSGGAVGIDAAAHRAALAGAGGTSVVLGCGHDVAYPRSHARSGGLFDRILTQGGGLVSEQLPAVPPRAGIVRARNRIVAGLADVVVVVEGGERSGALLTADAAAERGRPVLAVPGDIRVPSSAAPNRLLAEGAGACTDPSDLLAALVCDPVTIAAPARAEVAGSDRSCTVLPAEIHRALAAAWPRALPRDGVIARSGLGPAAVLAALTRAQMAGEVAERPDGFVLRRAPVAGAS